MTTTDNQEFIPSIDPVQESAATMFGQILHSRIQAGALEQAITKKVDGLIDEVVNDVFRTYGDVAKAMKEQMTKTIMPQIADMSDLPSYHDFVMNRLKLATQNFQNERLGAVLDEELQQVFSEVPENITLSWIIEQVVNESKEYHDIESEGQITLIMRDPCHITGSIQVYFDKDADTDRFDCDYQLHLSKERNTENKYSILGLKVNNQKAGDQLAIGSKLYSADKVLFNVYAMKGLVELDEGIDASDYETDWYRYDD